MFDEPSARMREGEFAACSDLNALTLQPQQCLDSTLHNYISVIFG